MTTEVQAASGAAEEITAPAVPANPTEAATPEPSDGQQPEPTNEQPEQGDADKSVKRLQRRVDRVTAARYQAEAESHQLRQRLAEYERAAQPQEQVEQRQIRPEDIDRLATERAREMADTATVAQRSNAVFGNGAKEYGEAAFREIVSSVQEDAGQLIGPNGRATPLGEAILDAEKPHALLRYLHQNPDAAEQLQGLSPTQLGRRVARIEADMAKTAERTPSRAPHPLQPVKGSGASAGPTPGTEAAIAAKMKSIAGG